MARTLTAADLMSGDWQVARMRGSRVRFQHKVTSEMSGWVTKQSIKDNGFAEAWDNAVAAVRQAFRMMGEVAMDTARAVQAAREAIPEDFALVDGDTAPPSTHPRWTFVSYDIEPYSTEDTKYPPQTPYVVLDGDRAFLTEDTLTRYTRPVLVRIAGLFDLTPKARDTKGAIITSIMNEVNA